MTFLTSAHSIPARAVFLIGFAATAAQLSATHKHHDVLDTGGTGEVTQSAESLVFGIGRVSPTGTSAVEAH
ncbi:hypothetical protein PV963_42165 [Streptomyces coeruleorubidus]|uniref:hypothetical protein n=1 Tax=Streptomyces coeruleorubidus TaxID=116188 RepID=UPI00237EEAF9|nr:hypothetical protein [Streptomyces coeruleorubidus]WDV56477.1 hypothetical protein PV963_42165 [Streptomyces coeruleorubidus]